MSKAKQPQYLSRSLLSFDLCHLHMHLHLHMCTATKIDCTATKIDQALCFQALPMLREILLASLNTVTSRVILHGYWWAWIRLIRLGTDTSSNSHFTLINIKKTWTNLTVHVRWFFKPTGFPTPVFLTWDSCGGSITWIHMTPYFCAIYLPSLARKKTHLFILWL